MSESLPCLKYIPLYRHSSYYNLAVKGDKSLLLYLGADSLFSGITCKSMEKVNRTYDTNALVFFES